MTDDAAPPDGKGQPADSRSAPALGAGPEMDDPRLASMSPEELRAAMRSLGYETQADIAKAIGVNRSTVSLWLDGKVGVPRPVAMLLRILVAAQRRPF